MSQIENALSVSAADGPNSAAGKPQPPHHPILLNSKALEPLGTTISVAGHAVIADASGVRVDGVNVEPGGAPTSVSEVAAVIHGSSIVLASQIVPLAHPTLTPTWTIDGYIISPASDGISVDG